MSNSQCHEVLRTLEVLNEEDITEKAREMLETRYSEEVKSLNGAGKTISPGTQITESFRLTYSI